MKHNLLKSLIISVILLMGVSNAWAWNFTKGTVIYFDNTLTNWSTINLRVGTSSNTIWSNTYPDWTKVPGTASLYKLTLPECNNYEAFSFANNSGWTDNNTIYQPYNKNGVKPDGIYKITQQTEYFKWHLDHTRMFIPSSTSSTEHECKYYNTTVIDKTNTHPDYYKNTVNLVPHEGGTVTISYTNENGQTINKTDGSFNVAQTCILTVKSVDPIDGYEFNQVSFYDGEHYHVKKIGDTFTVRAGTTIYPEFVTSETNKVYLKLSNSDWTQVDATIAVYAYYNVYIDEVSPGDWFVMHKIPSKDNNIYSCEIPKGYTGFSFVRLRPNGHNGYVADNNGFNWDNKWNQSEDLTFTEVITEYPFGEKFYNLTTKTNIDGKEKYTGTWTKSNSVKIDPCEYGKFGIIFDNEMIWCNVTHDLGAYKEVKIPTDAKIEIVDFEESSLSPGYMRNPRYKYSTLVQINSTAEFINLDDIGLVYTVTEDIWVVPNIVMAQPHTVYLHIPKEFKDSWNGAADYKWNTMYLTDYLSGGQIILDDKRVAHLLTAEKDDVLSANGNGEYWRFNVPAGYHTFIIERKTNNIDGDKGEGGAANNSYFCSRTPKFYFRNPLDKEMCFTLTEHKGGQDWEGYWTEVPRNFTVELGYCEFGEYKVMCNGNIYTSTTDHNVSFEAPYGSEITFAGGTPLYDIYKGGWMLRKVNGADKITRLDATQPYILTGDILLDDNFVTKDPRVCYLAVPQDLDKWNRDNTGYFIWRRDEVGGLPMIGYSHQGTYEGTFTKDDVGYKYYKFTILEECNKIYFQHKEPGDPNINNPNTPHAKIQLDRWDIPMTDKNCFYLTGEEDGEWGYLPVDEGKYRLLYVEQVVEKDKDNNTVLTRKKAHPSDIFTKEDITTYTKDGNTFDGKLLSLHVYRDRPYTGICWYDEESYNHKTYNTQTSNAGVILQNKVDGKWVDISNNMVFGPLEAVPELALLPGRKNAASSYSSENITNLYYDDGIDPIKNDEHEDEGNGVWNFVVKKDDSGNVYIALNETHRYEGEYYIRTLATANDGWENYTDHKMTRSDISKVHSNYSHYFCKWIKKNTDVQFTIANYYGCAISDTLMSDRTDLRGERTSEAEKIVRGITLPQDASIRFSWNEKTNFIHRAYLGGSTHVEDRFLVLTGSGDDKLFGLDGQQLPEGKDNLANPDPRYGLNANEEIFTDISNWVYYADVKMKPRAQVKLTADYKWKEGGKDIEVIQYFVGTPTEFCDTTLNTADGAPECKQQYRMRLLYDFKTNELISAYVPGENKNIEQIKTNVMLIRQENKQASQFSFETNEMDAVGKRSYGVLELTRSSLIDNYTDDDYYRVSLYWISFPFDVAIKDIFGFGTYGEHWLIQSYNGQKRADNGLWADSDTNWEYHFKPNTLNADTQDEGIMKKGVGYVVALNRSKVVSEFKGRIKTIALYFPATTTIQDHIVKGQSENIDVPAHECKINRGTPQGDRRIKDSHWNVIGVPSYVDANGKFNKINTIVEPLKFYYRWLGQYDMYEPVSAAELSFESTKAYMVQFAGNLNWSNVVEERSSIAAKRNTENSKEHHLRLNLLQNGQEQDHTYVVMQDEDVTTGFDFNYDLCKIINKGANIYSIITKEESPVNVTGNVLPIEEAIIPLGVVTTTAGEYTFAMPNGTDGIVVELIDYETNTRTNMLLDNYTVNLGKGTFENRFALHVKPDKTTTSVDNLGNEATGDKVKKYLIDGVLYMQKDGVLYDAQGRKL